MNKPFKNLFFKHIFAVLIPISLICQPVYADVKIPMFSTKTEKSVGYVMAKDTQYGLILTPHLFDLPSGVHGFHIHVNPNCGDHGMAAGGHFDPAHTAKHLGPYNNKGHLGDLPSLVVNKKGIATLPILAPRLTIKLIAHHSLMIHSGADNYSDQPPMGGGGDRIACGVIS